MDDIAREAEYSKATLYVYFESKEEIVGAILLNGLALLNKRVQEAIQGQEDWKTAYEAVCKAIVEFYGNNPTAYEAVMGGGHTGAEGSRNDKDVRRMTREFCDVLAGFFQTGQETGMITRKGGAMELVMYFWACISGLIHLTDREKDSLQRRTGRSREEFLQNGFQMIYWAVTGT